MFINKNKFYCSVFIIILLSQIYIQSFKLNIFLQIFFLISYFILEKSSISIKFFKIILPIILIFFIGFIGVILNLNPINPILKDIFHFIKPIQGILIGYLFFKTINNQKLFIKTIILTGFLSAIIHFIIIISFVEFSSINHIRQFTRDNFLELISISFLIYNRYNNKFDFFYSKKIEIFVFILILTSCILYFSRSMLIVSFLIFLTIKGYTRLNINSLKYIATFIIGTILLYTYLYSVKIERNGKGIEAFLYKIKIAPEEIFQSKIDRENHVDLWDHWRGYEAKRALALMDKEKSSYIIGMGFGSLVNLKFYAPLTEDNKGLKYISELHNGYIYVFYKLGLIGLIFYLFFLIYLYNFIYLKKTFESIFISIIGLFYLYTTLTITGIYNNKDTLIFILGALLYFHIKNLKQNV
jgi:hypothetical protein